jgi:protein-tyrosine-phosphatase
MSSDSASFALRFRRIARGIRHTPDRAMHPLRRRSCERRVQRLGLPRSVLFVCHGNICRSPYAEKVFVQRLPRELREYMTVLSAGFVDPGRGSPAHAVSVAAARGVELRSHRSRVLSRAMVAAMDLVIVMDRHQRDEVCERFGTDRARVLILGDLDPLAIDMRTVRDPILQPREVFDETYTRIDRCVAALLTLITGTPVSLPATASATDIPAEEPTHPARPASALEVA